MALMDAVYAQIARAAVRHGFAALANVDLGRAVFDQRLQLTQVIQMAVGNIGQSLEAGIAMYLECPLTQLARGRTGHRAMQGNHLGQQLDVFWGVAPNKGHGRCAPPIVDGAVLIKLPCSIRLILLLLVLLDGG